MTDFRQALEDPAVRRLAWTLVAFLWQGTLVAAVLACLEVVLRGSEARARYAAACASLLLMLVLPVATFARHREVHSSPPREAGSAAAADAPDWTRSLAAAPAAARQISGGFVPALRKSVAALAPWLVPVWFCGVLLLSLRFLAGWSAASGLPLRGVQAAPAALEVLSRLQRRMRISRPVLLLESAEVGVPTALGALRPAILMPICAVTGLSPEALEAVLAHELAHIRRHDYFVNLLQTCAETLLFYHPAVWWVSRRVRVERENCCDDLAVAATGDARGYARALLALEEIRSLPESASFPAVAANGGSLRRRIARLLPPSSSRPEAPRRIAGLLALTALVTIGAAAEVSRLSEAPEEPLAFRPAPRFNSPDTAAKLLARSKESSLAVPPPVAAVAGGVAGGVSGGFSGGVEGVEEENTASGEKKTSLSSEDLENLKRHGVTPEFLGELAALGYTTATVEDLLSLRVHGVTADDISAMTALLGRLSLDELVSLRIHGVTPEFVKHFREAGYTEISADDAISLRIHGVEASTASEWAKLSAHRPGLDEIVSARIHGVTPDFIREIQSLGYPSPSLDELTAMRIHGATPDFIRKANRSTGTRLSLDELLERRIHGRKK